VDKVPFNAAYAYGSGSLVKTLNSPTVYVVKDLSNLFPINSFIYPQEFGLNTGVRTIISSYSVLNNLENMLTCNGTNYLATNGAAYAVSSSITTDYGFSQGQFVAGGTLCANISVSSQALDQFIRTSDGTIYFVSNGQKQAFTGYGVYQAHGGTPSNTVQVSDFFASTLATGSPITQ
jgi:predicted heme/steroid binding protein